MMSSKWTTMLCALVALGLLIGGCGGSDDDGAAPNEASAGQGGSGSSEGGGGPGGSAGGQGAESGGQGAESGGAPSDSSLAPGSERLIPKNEFAEEADEICTTSNQEIILRAQYYLQENKGSGKGVAALQAEAVDLIFIPNVKKQVKAIGELELPEGEEDEAEAFIAAMEEGIETTEDNTYTAANVEALGHEFHQANKRAQVLGVDGCGFGA